MKLILNKKRKGRTFYLPVEQAIVVPSTSGVKLQKRISRPTLSRRVNTVRRFLSDKFGGYTSVKATGGFILKNGRLIKEKVVKVTSFGTKKDFRKNKEKLFNQIDKWGRGWKQESIGYEHEGDLYLIAPPKKVMNRKISPARRKILLKNNRKR